MAGAVSYTHLDVYKRQLLDRQNEDGSWYRTYTKEGSPVFMNEDRDSTEEEKNRGRKASSAIPVPFLLSLIHI